MDIIKSMTNIKPDENQIIKIEQLREQYKNLVILVNDLGENSRCKNIAMTELETSLMWAVKSILL